MNADEYQPWIRVGVFGSGDYLDGYFSGGLSHDGSKYLASDDDRFCVGDIGQQVIIFKDDDDLELDNDEFIVKWNRHRQITIPSGAAAGTYDYCEPGYSSRIRCHYDKLHASRLGLSSHRLASGSPMISSFSESHFNDRLSQ